MSEHPLANASNMKSDIGSEDEIGARSEKSSGPIAYLQRYMHHHYPTFITKAIFVLFFLTALGFFAYFLNYLFAVRWPATSTILSKEKQDRLPATQVLLNVIDGSAADVAYEAYANNDYSQMVMFTVPSWKAALSAGTNYGYVFINNTIDNETQAAIFDMGFADQYEDIDWNYSIGCGSIYFFENFTECEPYYKGKPLFDGSEQSVLDSTKPALQETFSLQYHKVTDLLCYTNHMILNMTYLLQLAPAPLSNTMLDGAPGVSIFYLDSDIGARFMQTVRGPDPMATKYYHFKGVNSPLFIPMNSSSLVQLQYSKYIDVDGRVNMSTQLYFSGTRIMTLELQEKHYREFEKYINATYWQNGGAEANRILSMRSQPGFSYYAQEICFSPATFNIDVIHQIKTYTYMNFLADVGGFANMVLLTFSLFFPYVYPFVRPKEWLGSMMVRVGGKLTRSCKKDAHTQTDHAQARSQVPAGQAEPNGSDVKGRDPSLSYTHRHSNVDNDGALQLQRGPIVQASKFVAADSGEGGWQEQDIASNAIARAQSVQMRELSTSIGSMPARAIDDELTDDTSSRQL